LKAYEREDRIQLALYFPCSDFFTIWPGNYRSDGEDSADGK